MGGCVDGWIGVKAVLRAAYSNKIFRNTPIKSSGRVGGWMVEGGKSCFKDCLQQSKIATPSVNSVF